MIPSETDVEPIYIDTWCCVISFFYREIVSVLSKVEHSLQKQIFFFFLYVTDKNPAITWSFKSDILTLREELFAICFEQKLSSCQM